MNKKVHPAVVDLMLRAYAEATGAPMTSIIRDCLFTVLTQDLQKNKGVRDRYNVIYARLLKENNVTSIIEWRRNK